MEAARSAWPALGVLFVRDGLLRPEELEEILSSQHEDSERPTSRRLGEVLVERRLATGAQVARLVAEQHELPFVDLEDPDATVPLAGRITEELARRCSALPIRIFPDGSLLVVVADPTEAGMFDEIRRTVGVPVRFAVAASDSIESAIDEAAAAHGFREPDAEPMPPLLLATELPEPPVMAFDAWSAPDGPAARDESTWPVLGSLLLRNGLVTEQELENALAQQRLSSTRRLGEILVQRGTLTDRQVAQVLAEQHELTFVDLDEHDVDRDAASELPVILAREYGALPISYLADGSLLVAVADPTIVIQSEELRVAIGRPFELAVASPNDISAAIGRLESAVAETRDAGQRVDAANTMAIEHELVAGHGLEAATELELETEPEPWVTSDVEPEPALVTYRGMEVLSEVEPVTEPLTEPNEFEDTTQLEQEIAFDAEPEPVTDSEVEVEPEQEPAPVADEGPGFEIEPHSEPENEVVAGAAEHVAPSADEHDSEPEPEAAPPELTILQGGVQPGDAITEEIEAALALGASAVHVVSRGDGVVVRARINDSLREIATIASDQPESMIAALSAAASLGRATFTVDGRTVELRPTVLPAVLGERMTLRVVDDALPPSSLTELLGDVGARAALAAALAARRGLVVLCNPSADERAALLHAALHGLADPGRTIVAIEDPVEHLLHGVEQVEVDPRAGVTFATGLHAILRSDAELAAVGELVDAETVRLASRGADAGCAVVATLAAGTAAEGARRLIDLGAEPTTLAHALVCVVAVRRVRKVCSECRASSYATPEDLELLGRPHEESGRRLLAIGRGCNSCAGTGLAGSMRIAELLPPTEDVMQLLAGGAPPHEVEQAAAAAGMRTLSNRAADLCLDGLTSASEVARLFPVRH